MNLQQRYDELKALPGDINEHMDTLRQYASECSSVTELGVRLGVSTIAFLAGHPSYLTSFDIMPFPYLADYNEYATEAGTNFRFIQDNVLSTVHITETDLLFIDTMHSFAQLTLELKLHGDKARKYIIMHDTVTYATHDEGKVGVDGLPGTIIDQLLQMQANQGLVPAINFFLAFNNKWKIKEHYTNNNGLMILERR